uniref:GST N-terminal domain-containing protein n=1 Tax=Chromera velia CCMP2878 TaxID=1169474 RepID=A0A0G4GU15_9ALVE|eukprot:Cvel_23375.t1-p1 / transcript=Cvel_23375.t1 / gene=Cvel_23375 / organism=Chromera_velia_CCMP2878 / gene_product=Prostaglandin E synthase 2, putative / transcript_product=Prostaglandin E synthase 2, putative / location=Cvel_scaffold2401:23079-23927(-) / protein_length=283 / sequence_SO=supercontig / SO=protein_coding / is_pseudo=false
MRRSFVCRSSPAFSTATAGSCKASSAPPPLTLLQYSICPFCNKIKSVLDFLKVSYEVKEVNPLSKKELKELSDILPLDEKKGKPYMKVPVVLVGTEKALVDSSRILAELLSVSPGGSGPGAVIPSPPGFYEEEDKEWERWVDQKLSVLLFPNITRSFSESFQAFSYVNKVPSFSFWDKMGSQWLGATAMWMAQGKLKKKYQIEDERGALMEALGTVTKALGGEGKSGGVGFIKKGESPSFADIAVYSSLRSIEGLETHKDVMEFGDGSLKEWYEKVAKAVGHR